MKCYYHPQIDGVGFCAQCGKSACRDCIEDINGSMTCKGCMVRKLERREAATANRAAQQAMTRETAQRKIRTSKNVFKIATAVFFVVGLLTAVAAFFDPKQSFLQSIGGVVGTFVGAPFVGYLVWSCYWGIPVIWQKWWGALKGIGCFLILNPIMWLFLLVALFEIPIFVGYMYGVFGGAIYEYRKCQGIAEGRAERAGA
jgi:hypothetical protein